MRTKKQEGVAPETIEFVLKEYGLILDDLNLTPKQAFQLPCKELEGIIVSGKTLRKIFNGVHVHQRTIGAIVNGLGKTLSLRSGILNIVLETEKTEPTCEQ